MPEVDFYWFFLEVILGATLHVFLICRFSSAFVKSAQYLGGFAWSGIIDMARGCCRDEPRPVRNIMQSKTIIEFLEKLPKPVLILVALLLVLAIGDLDYITGYDVSVTLLYLFPVVLVAWFEGGLPALFISIFSALTWVVADLAAGHIYAHIGIEIWNAIMVLVLFLIASYFTVLLKKLLIRERHG